MLFPLPAWACSRKTKTQLDLVLCLGVLLQVQEIDKPQRQERIFVIP
jgi:hypothetical protein